MKPRLLFLLVFFIFTSCTMDPELYHKEITNEITIENTFTELEITYANNGVGSYIYIQNISDKLIITIEYDLVINDKTKQYIFYDVIVPNEIIKIFDYKQDDKIISLTITGVLVY